MFDQHLSTARDMPVLQQPPASRKILRKFQTVPTRRVSPAWRCDPEIRAETLRVAISLRRLNQNQPAPEPSDIIRLCSQVLKEHWKNYRNAQGWLKHTVPSNAKHLQENEIVHFQFPIRVLEGFGMVQVYNFITIIHLTRSYSPDGRLLIWLGETWNLKQQVWTKHARVASKC